MRTRYWCKKDENGGLSLVELPDVLQRAPRVYIQGDTMEPLMNHADGQVYDSRSAFRAATTAAGCVEVGCRVEPKGFDEAAFDREFDKAFDAAVADLDL